jgi:hypothetical protein
MLYSFGAREGEDRGVLESELVQSLVAPDLDRNVTTTALHDLREELLYLHHTGRRYRFEPKANLNLLIAEESKKWQPEEVLEQVRKEMTRLLAPAGDHALLWPEDSRAIPDGEPVFRVAYLGPAFTELDEAEIMEQVRTLVDKHGPGHREYRNAIAFAVPGRNALDQARAAARLLLAIGSLLALVKRKRLTLEREQVDELTERQKGVASDLAGAVERLYEQVLVPVPDRQGAAPFALETMDLRAQLTAGRDLHARILDALRKHVFDTLTPARLVALTKLGQERDFVATEELMKWFFSYFDFPKLKEETALRSAIARGTAGVLGYVSAAHIEEGVVVPSRTELIRFETATSEDEIDLGPGCFVLAPALAATLRGKEASEEGQGAFDVLGTPTAEEEEREEATDGQPVGSKRYRIRVETNASQLFRIMPALQNLADRASRFVARIDVEAESEEPFDRSWLRNAVQEHLDEAGVDAQTSLE